MQHCYTTFITRVIYKPLYLVSVSFVSFSVANSVSDTDRCAEGTQMLRLRRHATRTDGVDKVVEESVGEQRFRQLPEVHLQRSGDHVDVLPLPVLQVHLLVWTHTNT